MTPEIPVTDLLQTFWAVMGGSTINVLVFAWLAVNVVKQGQRLDRLDVNIQYLRESVHLLMAQHRLTEIHSERQPELFDQR